MHLSVVGCANFVCQLPDEVSHESAVHPHESQPQITRHRWWDHHRTSCWESILLRVVCFSVLQIVNTGFYMSILLL
jgi:hypothetical protein